MRLTLYKLDALSFFPAAIWTLLLPSIMSTPPVARTSTFTKTSIRILNTILLVGLFPGVSADCYIDLYVVTVIHPCSSQHPSYSLFSFLSNDGNEYCGSILDTGAIVGIAVGGGKNTPPILVDALALTPGLCPPQISSCLPPRRRPCRVGLSQAPVRRPDKYRLPPNKSSSLHPACSTGSCHGLWESIWWGPTAVHTL